VRRLTAWIGGALGGITVYRFLRRQHAATVPAEPEAAPEPDERAEELKAKLAESREAEPEPVAPAPAEADAEPESPEERRQRVHDEGRATLDEMKSE
jgi:hypothetical protein